MRQVNTKGKFEYVDDEEHVTIVSYGDSLDQAFEHIGNGLCEMIAPKDELGEEHTKRVSVEGETITQTLKNYLEELLNQIQTHQFVIKHIYYLVFTRTESGFKISCELVGDCDSQHHKNPKPSAIHHIGMRIELVKEPSGYEVAVNVAK